MESSRKETNRSQIKASNPNDGKLAAATKSVTGAEYQKLLERTGNVHENKGCQDFRMQN